MIRRMSESPGLVIASTPRDGAYHRPSRGPCCCPRSGGGGSCSTCSSTQSPTCAGRAVLGDDDHLGLGSADLLERLPDAQDRLAGLENKLQLLVDVVSGLLRLLCHHLPM